jgi:hypothetical protein
MPNRIKVDFFIVTVPDGSRPFEDIVRDVASSADDETRNEEIDGYPVRLQKAHFSTSYVEADMLKIHMSNLPAKASLDGDIGDLPLTDDEGLGNESAFLYHPPTCAIAVQRNRNGVSHRYISRYFAIKEGLHYPIIINPIVQEDAMERMMRMKETRKMRIKFAGITNDVFLKKQGRAVSDMVDFIQHFKAPSALIELSMGYKRGSLFTERIKAFINKLFVADLEQDIGIDAMEVSGLLDDDTVDVLDVLSYKMVEIVEVEENSHRRSTYKKRRPEIKQAWDKRRAEIERMFKAKK